jgi:hypothetical protein
MLSHSPRLILERRWSTRPARQEDRRALVTGLSRRPAGNPGKAEGQAAATQRLRGIVAWQQPRPARLLGDAIQRQPFRPGEVVVHPFQQPFEEMVGLERRAVRKHRARLGSTEIADITAARGRFGSVSTSNRRSEQRSSWIAHTSISYVVNAPLIAGLIQAKENS